MKQNGRERDSNDQRESNDEREEEKGGRNGWGNNNEEVPIL